MKTNKNHEIVFLFLVFVTGTQSQGYVSCRAGVFACWAKLVISAEMECAGDDVRKQTFHQERTAHSTLTKQHEGNN